MNPDRRQTSPRPTQGLWILVCTVFLCLAASPALTDEIISENSEQTASWYQVEVVIFTQQGFMGNEKPTRDYQLDFPQKVVVLRDTDYIGNNYPIPNYLNQIAPFAPGSDPDGQRAIPVVSVEDPAISFLNASLTDINNGGALENDPLVAIPLRDNSGEAQAGLQVAVEPEPKVEEEYIPQYEKPFIKLERGLRNLNDSARALNRRAKYNVLFHEAWRFAADKNSDDPWVIIKAGKQHHDRFEIEGSLRFYKSRFLHFQSDLWLLDFADNDGTGETIELPPFPEVPLPSLSEGQEVLEATIDESALERFFYGESSIEEEPKNPDEISEKSGEYQDSGITPAAAYQVSTLWTFDQSKRLEEEQSYYLDHPKMGILVTIKSHQVEITNPLEEIEEELSSEGMESASVSTGE